MYFFPYFSHSSGDNFALSQIPSNSDKYYIQTEAQVLSSTSVNQEPVRQTHTHTHTHTHIHTHTRYINNITHSNHMLYINL